MDKKRIIVLVAIVIILIVVFCIYYFISVKKQVFADLIIEPGNLSFTPQELEAGDSVTINAKISNIGDKKAKNILVQFFNGNPEKMGEKIQEIRIDFIESKQNKDVSINGEASFGLQDIYILIDPNNEIQESNEENNKTGIQIMAVLPIIETKDLSKEEFLQDTSIKELYNIVRDEGFSELVSASHITHSDKTESIRGVFTSEQDKVGYLLKFDSEEYELYEEPFFMEIEGEEGKNIAFITGETRMEVKDGKLFTNGQASSCDKTHCWGSCIVYNIFVNQITSEVLKYVCKACYYAVFAPIPEPVHIAAPCATCAGIVGTIAGVCGGLCLHDSCLYCMSDSCGDSKWIGSPYCYDDKLLYQEYDGYSCSNPITIGDILPGAPDVNSFVNTSHCDKYKGPKLKEDCPVGRFKKLGFGESYCSFDYKQILRDELLRQGYCDAEQQKCLTRDYSVPQAVDDCSQYDCQYHIEEGKKSYCKDAKCICCETDMYCLEQTQVGEDLGYVCIDSETLGRRYRFNNYKCQDSPADWDVAKTCFEYMEFENVKEKDCTEEYIWGPWECKSDNKTRFRKYGLYDLKCEDNECKPKVLITEGESEFYSCTNYCFEGECVECLHDDHCGEDSVNWEDWKCDGEDGLKRKGNWLDYRCTEEHECKLETKEKLETRLCPNDLPKCASAINECVECISNDQCAISQVCGPDYKCVGCTKDDECPEDILTESSRCDGNTLIKEEFRYKYSCEDGACKKGEAQLVGSSEQVCDGTCYQGKCVDCVIDADCGPISYGTWQGDWYCKTDSIAARESGHYASKCIDKSYCITEQVAASEEEKECAANERCQLGECIKKYGLIVGESGKVVRFSENPTDSSDFTTLSTPSGFTNNLYDVDFYPGGALIAGNSQGSILQYNGQTLTEILNFNNQGNYTGIAFKPDNEYYGLIVGDKIVQRSMSGNFPVLPAAGDVSGNDIAWNPDGIYALIIEDGTVYKYTYSTQQFISLNIPENILQDIPGFEDSTWSNANIPLVGISWKPDGSEAYIISDIGIGLKYNGSSFSVDYDSDNLPYTVNWQAIDFKPDGSFALIVGSWGEIEKYDGNSFTAVSADSSIDFSGVVWISGTKALIVGGKWVEGSADGHVLVYDDSNGSVSTVLSGIDSLFLGVNW